MPIRLPSPWMVALFAALAGLICGSGSAVVRAVSTPWQTGDLVTAGRRADGRGPRADTDSTRHAFGSVRLGESGGHEFVIRNSGDEPLELTKGATSCTCTISDFESAEGGDPDAMKLVQPGAATRVKIQWKGKGSGGPFRQQATIFTNDPARPEIVFVVEGVLVPTWRAEPEAVVLSRLTQTVGEQATVRIFTYGEQPPKVTALSIDHTEAAQFFSLSSTPLAAADIASDPQATGGVAVAVDVRPGLPLGRLQQTITAVLQTPEEHVVQVPVVGTVSGDLALAGAAWDSSRQAMMLGTVSSKTGLKTQVFLTTKGPHRDRVRPVLREVVPAAIQVEIGETRPVGSGAVVRTPITIVIPPGSPTANHLCSSQAAAGRIVLDTGLPDTPSFTIPICIAIGP